MGYKTAPWIQTRKVEGLMSQIGAIKAAPTKAFHSRPLNKIMGVNIPWTGFVFDREPTDQQRQEKQFQRKLETRDETAVVGGGNLKLHYATNEGKLTYYINNRNLVSALP
ncbi:hypothetical protein Tco_0235972 [Tanacetum coccineum]